MITETVLLKDKKYKFKNLALEVLEKDSDDNVHVFSAVYVRATHNNKLSEGLREVNQLWDEGSGRRPPGYYVFSAYKDGEGRAKSVMISEEFLDMNKGKLDDLRLKYAGGWELVN